MLWKSYCSVSAVSDVRRRNQNWPPALKAETLVRRHTRHSRRVCLDTGRTPQPHKTPLRPHHLLLSRCELGNWPQPGRRRRVRRPMSKAMSNSSDRTPSTLTFSPTHHVDQGTKETNSTPGQLVGRRAQLYKKVLYVVQQNEKRAIIVRERRRKRKHNGTEGRVRGIWVVRGEDRKV